MIKVAREQLEILVQLQQIEIETNKIKSQLSELPRKIEKIDQEYQAAEVKIRQEENRLAELKKKYRSHESDAEMNLSRIKKSKDKLQSVKTNKEYQLSLKEIEDLEHINSKIEDDMIECLETMDSIQAEIDIKNHELLQLTDQIKEEKELLQKESDLAQKRLTQLNTDWSSLTKMVDSELLKKYNSVKEMVGNIAITAVKKAVCQGCNVNIPPQLYNELQRFDSLMFCPHCQRIIYPLAS
jgi:predicted  nucleic acid-binding Zn-ribbon protein